MFTIPTLAFTMSDLGVHVALIPVFTIDRSRRSPSPGTRTRTARRRAALARIAQIRARIRTFERLASGTLLKRTKMCGKPACPCAHDPRARHGPYYEWGRMQRGRLVHRMVSPAQATLLREALGNYRTLRRLLRVWETETVTLIEADTEGR